MTGTETTNSDLELWVKDNYPSIYAEWARSDEDIEDWLDENYSDVLFEYDDWLDEEEMDDDDDDDEW